MAEAYFVPEHSVRVKHFSTVTKTERFKRVLEKNKISPTRKKGLILCQIFLSQISLCNFPIGSIIGFRVPPDTANEF